MECTLLITINTSMTRKSINKLSDRPNYKYAHQPSAAQPYISSIKRPRRALVAFCQSPNTDDAVADAAAVAPRFWADDDAATRRNGKTWQVDWSIGPRRLRRRRRMMGGPTMPPSDCRTRCECSRGRVPTRSGWAAWPIVGARPMAMCTTRCDGGCWRATGVADDNDDDGGDVDDGAKSATYCDGCANGIRHRFGSVSAPPAVARCGSLPESGSVHRSCGAEGWKFLLCSYNLRG